MDISVIIVSYRASCFLEQCLHSVQQASRGYSADVWVVDNHSDDGTKEFLGARFPGVHFIWLKENKGFAAANNLAWKESTGKHILFLNPDVILPEDFFRASLSEFGRNDKTGAMGFRMIDGSGQFLRESKRGNPTLFHSISKMAGLSSLFPHSRLWAGYYAGHLPDHASADVDVLAGACMLMSRQSIEATGGFDEQFFMYAEDIDLSIRLRKAGFTNRYFAGMSIIHFKGESTQKLTSSYIRHFYGSMSLYIRKHYADQALMRASMLTAVFFGRLAATAGMALGRMTAGLTRLFKPKQKPLKTLVLGTQEGLNEVLKLVSLSPQPLVLSGRISPDTNDQAYSLGSMKDIHEIISQSSADALIFCLGDVDAQSAIACMQSFPRKLNFYFHYRGTRSLVASHSRNQRGIQLTAGI